MDRFDKTVLDGELRCPVCGHARWAVEIDHMHCGKCDEVLQFHEVSEVIRTGKRSVGLEMEKVFGRPLS